MSDLSQLIEAAHKGDRQAAAELLPLVESVKVMSGKKILRPLGESCGRCREGVQKAQAELLHAARKSSALQKMQSPVLACVKKMK